MRAHMAPAGGKSCRSMPCAMRCGVLLLLVVVVAEPPPTTSPAEYLRLDEHGRSYFKAKGSCTGLRGTSGNILIIRRACLEAAKKFLQAQRPGASARQTSRRAIQCGA